ncbi:MAG TPA: hypothetical protein ENN11_03185 [Methanomicrobia archaeon]|nr:hypothetical protein [Methanomicrobia archaeon]
MKEKMKKGMSLFIGAIILLSLVYINAEPAEAANAITGNEGAVWFDLNGNDEFNAGEGIDDIGVYLDNAGSAGATTAADGSFLDVFSGSPVGLDWDGLHYLTFKADGFLTVSYNVDNSGGTLALAGGTVEMHLQDSIYGRVVDTSGSPVAGVKVEALDHVTHALATDVLGDDAVVRTDQFGNFVFKGLPADTYDIRTSKDQYVSQVKTAVRVIRGQTTQGINFAISKNFGSIEGHVSNGSTPIENAEVSIKGLGLSAITDSDGYYKITGVMPGSYTMICEMDGYKTDVLYYDDSGAFGLNGGPLSPFVQPGPPVTPVPADFNLAPEPLTPTNGYISGIVTDVNGNPIEAATVEVPGLGLATATDRAGYYFFEEVPNGEYDVVVTDPCPMLDCEDDEYMGLLHHKTAKERVEVIPNLNAETNFELEENPGFIVGQILDKDGLPVQNVSVSIPNTTISSLTDVNGWYVLEGINIERYSVYDYDSESICYYVDDVIVRTNEPDYYTNTLTVTPLPANESFDNSYDITIVRRTGIINGVVYDRGSNTAIEGARVRAYGREAITDDSGIYEFVQVPVGSYTVVADDGGAGDYEETTHDVVVRTGITVSSGAQSICNFQGSYALPDETVSNYGYVSGVAYEDTNKSTSYEEGEGLSGVTVEIPGYAPVTTDDFGFYFVKTDAGDHNMVAYKDDYDWWVADPMVGVTADMETPGVNIMMERLTGELVGRVTEDGDPVDQAALWIPGYFNSWHPFAAFFNSNLIVSDFYGNYAFANIEGDGDYNAIPKGRHLLITQKYDYEGGGEDTFYEPWYEYEFNFVTISSTVTKNISLTRETGRVEGYVWEDKDGDLSYDPPTDIPLPDANVSLSRMFATTSDTTGYYTILDVPITKDFTLSLGREINRYTGIAELNGYDVEKYESPSPPTPDDDLYKNHTLDPEPYLLCNNIPVYEEVYFDDVTSDIGYPMDKADPLPVTGSVSGDVELSLNDINAETEVWIQNSDKATWSDIEGFWILLDVDPANYAIQASKPFYVSQIQYNVPVTAGHETDNIDYTLEKDGALKGHVYEDVNHNGVYDDTIDVPVRNATVSIAGRQVTTDINGAYYINGLYSNLPYIGYTVTCTKQDYSLAAVYDVDIVHGGTTSGVDFLIEKEEGLIMGYVRDSSTNDGIEGIEVLAMDDDIPSNEETGDTDSNGWYVLVANRGTYTLQAPMEPNGTDYVTKERYDVDVPGRAIVTEHFMLWDETTMPDNNLYGIVWFDDNNDGSYDAGEEVGNVEVSIPGLGRTVFSSSSVNDDIGVDYNFIFMDVPNDGGRTYHVTAKEEITGTTPQQYTMTVARDQATNTQVMIELPSAPSTPYDSWIEGIVFWDMNDNGVVDENERIPDMPVYVPGSGIDNDVATAGLKAETDSTGYYIINEVPSEINNSTTKMTVVTGDLALEGIYEPGIQRNLPMEGGSGKWIDFPLMKTTSYTSAYLFGEVYFDANDNDQYDVDASVPETEGIVNASVTADSVSEDTDSFGFYILEGLTADETYLVEVNAAGYESHEEYTTVELGLNTMNYSLNKLTNTISGYVFEDVNDNGVKDAGDKVINAKIIAVKNGGGTFEAFTDDTGFYSVPSLPVGTYALQCEQIVDGSELPEYQDWQIEDPIVITEGDIIEQDIPMSRYFVDVNGNVTDGTDPLQGVVVDWFSPDDFTTPVFTTSSDSSGDWVTTSWTHADLDYDGEVDDNEDGVPVGTWFVKFSKTGYEVVTKWVTLDFDDVGTGYTIDVAMTEVESTLGIIEGTVDNANDATPIQGATVKATETTSLDEYYTSTLADGSYSLNDLPPGTYDVECTKIGFDDGTASGVSVTANTTTTQDFSLDPNAEGFGEMEVTVEDEGTNLYEGALVTVWHYNDTTTNKEVYEFFAEATTDSSGVVTFTNLPTDADGETYVVCASDNDGNMIMDAFEFLVEDGDTDTATLTLEPGTASSNTFPDAGWYMMSFPVLVPEDVPWPALLYASGIDSSEWQKVAQWTDGVYEYYDPTLVRDTDMWYAEADRGYWLRLNAAATLTVVGEESTERVLNLTGGQWSLIGYNLLTANNDIATAMDVSVTDSVNLMWTYLPDEVAGSPLNQAQLYDPRGRFASGFDEFNPWHGYWIYCDDDCTITIS